MTIEEHYKTLAPKLTNWLVSTGSPYHEACDIVQNTFLKIWKMRDDLQDNDTAVSGLVFTIARNLRKNMHRDDKHLVFSDEPPEAIAKDHAQEDGNDSEYLRKRISEALSQLAPNLRETFTLFQIGDMSVREISAQTGVSENLVKVRIHRAKEKLKTLLSDLRVTF